MVDASNATRDGAPPIDLVDGDRLCELLKRYDLGVRTVTRTVEDITIDAAFFGDICGHLAAYLVAATGLPATVGGRAALDVLNDDRVL
jgi:hypothetical protein